jgi:hypothetical protein
MPSADAATKQVTDILSGQSMSLADLKQQVASAQTQLQNIDSSTIGVKSLTNRHTDVYSSGDGNNSRADEHADYRDQIAGHAKLLDNTFVRKIAHNFAVEQLWMYCNTGERNKIDKFTFEYCGRNYEWDETETEKAEPLSTAQIETEFIRVLLLDIEAQHDVNKNLMQMDFEARKAYLDNQIKLISDMVEQQTVLAQSLKDWSHYMDSRADEYAKLYERLEVVTNTTKRRDVFETNDLHALDGWNRLMTNVFWLLLVVLLVMVVVQHYSELSSMATRAKEKMRDSVHQLTESTTSTDEVGLKNNI